MSDSPTHEPFKPRLGVVLYYENTSKFASITTELGVVSQFGLFQAYGEGKDITKAVKEWIKTERLDRVLWWILPRRVETVREIQISTPEVRHGVYNWDEPHIWRSDTNWGEKTKLMDVVMVSCSSSLARYPARTPKFRVDPGVDLKHFRPSTGRRRYLYDVSLICTNLYEDTRRFPMQLVSRPKILALLAEKLPHARVALFGPEGFREQYPRIYAGMLSYEDLPRAISQSAVNLCTHVETEEEGYLNERVAQVLACGGLLLTDQVAGSESFLRPGRNCILMDLRSLDRQLESLVQSPRSYDPVRKAARETAEERFSAKGFAQKLLKGFEVCEGSS
eukprot:jgi/Bigna1/136851/aug1.36_g11559